MARDGYAYYKFLKVGCKDCQFYCTMEHTELAREADLLECIERNHFWLLYALDDTMIALEAVRRNPFFLGELARS